MNPVSETFERAFRDLSVHYGRVTAQLHEEASRLAGHASDGPITRREMGEAFQRISESVGSFQAVLYNIAERLAELSSVTSDDAETR